MNAVHWLTLHGFVTMLASLVYVVHAHAMHQRRQPAAAIAWMLFILLLPYLALPAYLVFGSRKLERPDVPVPGHGPDNPDPLRPWAVSTALALRQPAPQTHAGLRLHADGAAARSSLLAMIDGAQHSIDLCTFILANDELGETVLQRLCARAEAGVRVRLLLDGLGKLMTRPPNLKRLNNAGGTHALFVPPLRSPLKGRTNLRNHRKLVLVDSGSEGAQLWSGGRNLAAEYFGGRAPKAPWRDLSFTLRGPLLDQAAHLFECDWCFANGLPAPTARQAKESLGARPTDLPPHSAQLIASGPDQSDDTLYAMLLAASYRAGERIALATPYFVPDQALVLALCLAARRGVEVDVLMPARSNHRLSDIARGRALRSLTQAGGRVWLTPGMLHAKLALFDRDLALAGSANLDSRSLFLNYEMMFAFHDPHDVRVFADWFERERAGAAPFTPNPPGLLRDTAEGLLLWTGFQL
jgi:cardiolipin synthase A/B